MNDFLDGDDEWTPLDYPGGLVDEQFERGQWNGLPQLTCIYCEWDTLQGIEAARAHKQVCPRRRSSVSIQPPTQAPAADKNQTPRRMS